MPVSYLRWVSVLLTLFWLLGVSSVQAQSEIALASLQVELWPEFDQPTTLVILDGRLETNVTLPAKLTLRLPAQVSQPHAVAVRNANGELLNTPYTTTLSGEILTIVFQADTSEFRVEYYDPTLTIQGNNRAYTFRWQMDYPIGEVAVRVQQPVNATNLTLDPAFTPAGAGEYGLNYYVATLGALPAGQHLTIQLAYQKSTTTLSAEAMGAASTTNTSPPTPTSLSPLLVIGLSVGTLLVLGGVIWYARAGGRPRARKSTAHSASAHRRHRPTERPQRELPQAGPGQVARFCTQCGQRAEEFDQFCRTCGTKLRV